MTYYYQNANKTIDVNIAKCKLQEIESHLKNLLKNFQEKLTNQKIETLLAFLTEYAEISKNTLNYEHLGLIVDELSTLYELQKKSNLPDRELIQIKNSFLSLLDSLELWRENFCPEKENCYIGQSFYEHYIKITAIFKRNIKL